jgi:hypothetical protein
MYEQSQKGPALIPLNIIITNNSLEVDVIITDDITFAVKESKDIPVTGRGGLQVCEMSRFPHCLDSRLTDGVEAVSLTRRAALYSPETFSDTHSC